LGTKSHERLLVK